MQKTSLPENPSFSGQNTERLVCLSLMTFGSRSKYRTSQHKTFKLGPKSASILNQTQRSMACKADVDSRKASKTHNHKGASCLCFDGVKNVLGMAWKHAEKTKTKDGLPRLSRAQLI